MDDVGHQIGINNVAVAKATSQCEFHTNMQFYPIPATVNHHSPPTQNFMAQIVCVWVDAQDTHHIY